MPTVLIDNHEMTIPAGQRLNGIEAARLAGVEIPYYCWHPGLTVVGSCRMCLVEVGSPRRRDAAKSRCSRSSCRPAIRSSPTTW